MKKFAAWLAVTSLLGAQAQAASTSMGCLTDEEFSNVLLLLAPEALKAMGEQCAAVLPKGAVLGNPESPLVKNFAAASEGAMTRLAPVFARFASAGDIPATPELGAVFKSVFEAEMKKEMKGIIKNPKDCASIDRLLKLTEPLPPANFAAMVVEIARLAEKDGKAKGSKASKGGGNDFLCPRD